MSQSHFKAFLLISLMLLSLHLPQGHGRMIRVVRNHQEKPTLEGRTMVEMVNDYQEPGANTNPRSANLFNPHTPPRA